MTKHETDTYYPNGQRRLTDREKQELRALIPGLDAELDARSGCDKMVETVYVAADPDLEFTIVDEEKLLPHELTKLTKGGSVSCVSYCEGKQDNGR